MNILQPEGFGLTRLKLSGSVACSVALTFALATLASRALDLPALDLPKGLTALGVLNVVLVALAVLVFAWRRPPAAGFGLANAITLTRGAIAALLAAAVPFPQAASLLAGPLAIAAVLALALDGLDGWWARRTGTTSAFGARFDQEMDALLIAALCALTYVTDRAGAWVLAAGALRYAYCAAGRLWPWLARPLPGSRRRQTICVTTVVALIASLGPWLPGAAASGIAGFAVTLLFASFAVDVAHQYTRRTHPAFAPRRITPR